MSIPVCVGAWLPVVEFFAYHLIATRQEKNVELLTVDNFQVGKIAFRTNFNPKANSAR